MSADPDIWLLAGVGPWGHQQGTGERAGTLFSLKGALVFLGTSMICRKCMGELTEGQLSLLVQLLVIFILFTFILFVTFIKPIRFQLWSHLHEAFLD